MEKYKADYEEVIDKLKESMLFLSLFFNYNNGRIILVFNLLSGVNSWVGSWGNFMFYVILYMYVLGI